MDIQEQLRCGKETVALRITNQRFERSEFAHIVLDVVYVKNTESSYSSSIGYYDNYLSDKNQYKGLKATCTMSSSFELPYAWKLGVDERNHVDLITLSNAEQVVKTLRSIQKKLDKIASTEGFEDSFEEFAVRLVRVLGVRALYIKEGSNVQHKRCDDVSFLRSHLRSLIRFNQKDLGFADAA